LGFIASSKPGERYFEIAKNLDIFATLFKEVNALYVDDVNPNQLMRTGIDAMLESLDPYTNYIPEDEVEDYRTMNTGQYGGIGAITRDFDGRTVVTMIMEGFAAQAGGLKIGDEVIKIDNVSLAQLTREEANQLMKGQVGTTVKLSVKRFGTDQPIDLTFKREKIKVGNVPYSGMVGNDIAYIQLTDFTPDAGKEVRSAVIALKEKGAKGVIIDLRGNLGGLLMEAVNISNIFIPKDQKVVSTLGKIPEHNYVYNTLNPVTDADIPVAVLINRSSASAAEIVAGTLQDYDRGVIIGEKSYGKGLVQVSRPLSYNSQVKITIAKYYTPTGRCIQVLDYTHRREDGSVAVVPDSIKKSFTTPNKRTVYDGGGIDPDIPLAVNEASTITQVLYHSGLIFDYATKYAYEHTEVPDPKTFVLSDDEYNTFTKWLSTKKYSYYSPMEIELQTLIADAKKEKYYESLKLELETLEKTIETSKKKDLSLYKDQIKKLLEEDIISRYHLEKGSVQAGFKYDEEVKKAIDVLHDPQQYKKILNIK
jgi:carboxyl-terminal processing protease